MDRKPELTVVVPLLNERESLPELYERIAASLDGWGRPWELLFMDDGSDDGSFALIKELAKKDPGRVRGVRFRRNYGKAAALAEGFRRASGRYVATMDADLQDEPGCLPEMVEKLEEGFDLVSGWKKKRNDPLSKTVPSRLFNFVTRLVTGIPLHDFNCGLKVYRREVTESVPVYGELHRYLPFLAYERGFKRITELPVIHHSRKYGRTKYGFDRLFKGFLDLLTVLFLSRYMRRPLHLFGLAGFALIFAGGGILAWFSAGWLLIKMTGTLGAYIGNRPLFSIAILAVIVGIQLVSIGLLGELISSNRAMERRYEVEDETE